MELVGTVAFVLPLVISALVCAWLIPRAARLGLVDEPDHRKSHRRTVPLGGGLAIFAGVASLLGSAVALAWIVQNVPSLSPIVPDLVRVHSAGVLSKSPLVALILGAGACQLILGLIDDLRGLGYRTRLVVECVIALVLVTQGVELAILPGYRFITVPLTVLWIVGLTNALNFIDNMDGLSGGVSAIASVFFATISLLLGDLFVAGCFLVLAGSLVGFLMFNWQPARIFMGDAGSNFLGFWMGVLTVVATFRTEAEHHITLLAPLCVLAVPIYDVAWVTLIRLVQGRSPFHPDRQHLSHRLTDLGLPVVGAVLAILLVTVVTGMTGLLLYFVSASASLLVLMQLVGILGILSLLDIGLWVRRPKPALSPTTSRPVSPEGDAAP